MIARAKSLGHLDLIPNDWYDSSPHHMSADASLEKQFLDQSHKHGISTARLKTVYFRGVEEFQDDGLEMGSASMWGLVRVQKYINAIKKCDPSMTDDADLCLTAAVVEPELDAGMEISVDSSAMMMSLVYGDGSDIVELFKPGVVESFVVDEYQLCVYGTLNEEHWKYALDTRTGIHNLSFMST